MISPQPVTFDPDHIIVGRGEPSVKVHVDQVSILHCRNCLQGVMVVEEQCVAERSWREGRSGGGAITWRGIHWWPTPNAHTSPDMPHEIAEAFQEAVRALHANCPRASVVMARRTLEAITVEKGQTTGVLADRLKNMATCGILLPTLADWAKEVRLVGNTGAHFDPIKPASKEDAQQLIAFVRELLRYLYEFPAELARRRGTP